MFHNTRFLKRVIESDFFKCIHLRKKHESCSCDILYENYLGLIKKGEYFLYCFTSNGRVNKERIHQSSRFSTLFLEEDRTVRNKFSFSS